MNTFVTSTVLDGLRASATQPVLFVGHGSPMNAIEDSVFRRGWQQLGAQFGEGGRWPRPQLVLCISAHWITRGWALTGMAQPRTIHDFGGFPAELFAQQYPAPGSPQVARQLASVLRQPHSGAAVQIDADQWGLDHGAWSVLKPMFAQADIPVIQLSMDYSRPPAEHWALGQQLSFLREQGVLIVASGNTVHNLSAVQWQAPEGHAYDWAVSFDEWTAQQILSGNAQALTQFQTEHPAARQAHPGHDHFLPLLYAVGAARATDQVEFFNQGYQLGSIAMRSVIWS